MKFDTIEDRMLYLRSMSDYKLIPNTYVMVMLDGKNFSKKIKKKFKKPFDEKFISLMNATAEYVCSVVQGARLAYVQSDEISILLSDFDTPNTDGFFGYRLCKMQSIIASEATSFFNREIVKMSLKDATTVSEMLEIINKEPLYQFDCKCWNLCNYNDVFSWFLYRQNDCIKNSKSQAAQTYLSAKTLLNRHTDEQIELLKEIHGIDWYDYSDSEKYGRLVYKIIVQATREVKPGEIVTYDRTKWSAIPAPVLSTDEGREKFEDIEVIKFYKNKT